MLPQLDFMLVLATSSAFILFYQMHHCFLTVQYLLVLVCEKNMFYYEKFLEKRNTMTTEKAEHFVDLSKVDR